jgi:serine/threonine protein kinase
MNAPLLPALPGYSDPELIAHGTTALVFRAIQTALNRPVAIKVITADTNPGSIPVNVERELATTVALSSQPHIVSIIDTGVTPDDRRYIVMEYCEGGSYAQILRQQGPLPVEDVIEVGIKIGQALHAAHEAGIVHRDVKPSNILRSRFGPALTDFGIARAPDELASTLTREMMTPHHASPEALLHQAQSGLSDVYSLASTMWTLLVGHPPFVDPQRPDLDMYQFRDRVLHEPLPPMPREDVPEWLVAELRRAMAKLPAQRHGSALEFSEALQRGALGIESVPATKSPTSTTSPTSAVSTSTVPPSTIPTTSTATTVTIVRPRATEDQPVRHTPGLPAEAWPVPDIPPASPPASGPAGADTPGADAPAPANPRRSVIGQPAASTTAPVAPATAAAPPAAPPAPVPTPPTGAVAPPAPSAPPTPSAPLAPAPSTPPTSAVPPAPATPPWAPPAPAPPSAPASPSGVAVPPASAPPVATPPASAPPVATPPAPAPPPPSGPAPSTAARAVPAPPGPAPAGPVPPGPAAPVPGPPDGGDGPIYRPRPDPAGPSAPATHPLGGPPPSPAEVEQEGWLPQPDESAGPGWAVPTPTPGEPRPHRDGVTAPSGGRRGGLLAVLVGVVVIAVTIGALLILSRGGRPGDPSTSGPDEASPTITVEPTLITAGPEGAPTDVRIDEDRGDSVTLVWTAPAGGPQSYVAVAYLAGTNDPLEVHTVPGGQSEMSVTFTGLDENENYCFAVGVLYSVSEVAPATVCTTR